MATDDAAIAGFFDGLADSWDRRAIHPPERVSFILAAIGLEPGSLVLDVGCGTGVLEPYLAPALGPEGRILAIDLSRKMLAQAREKRGFPTVEYREASFLALEPEAAFDLVVVYSAFPHFLDRKAFFEKSVSVLAPGGRLAIAHIESRASINAMHGAGSIPSLDLPPVGELAALAVAAGLEPIKSRDDEYYLLVAAKPGLPPSTKSQKLPP
jgi:demethylmenaquinone methyltransferase/2-methoxy-6-polyprenyl-1,4-benzoquinol methylase